MHACMHALPMGGRDHNSKDLVVFLHPCPLVKVTGILGSERVAYCKQGICIFFGTLSLRTSLKSLNMSSI